MISAQVKRFIEQYDLSGTFIVAFSGGYDSMCLLDVLHKLGADIVAVHLNHNWRGDESLAEAKACEEFSKVRNIRFYSEILPDSVKQTETAARDARYNFFCRCAEKFNSKVVFTAHNFDDNAETVLYRIIKGTGISGLKGIAEHRDIFYRPLLKIERAEIEDYCKSNGLKPNVDSSNFNTKYKRNFIRHKIIPMLKEINPKVLCALNSLSDIAKLDFDDNSYFIQKLLCDNNIEYDREKIENIKQFIADNKHLKSGKTMSLAKNLNLFVNCDDIKVIKEQEKSLSELKIKTVGEYKFDNYIFSVKPYNGKEIIFGDEYNVFVSLKDIAHTLRYRKDGDRIQPLGCNGSQKLKKYLNEKKIPNYKKDNIVLLCNGNEVLWAAGLGISEKIKVKDKPTHILSLRKDCYGL